MVAFLAADDHWKDRGVKKKLEVKTLSTQGMMSNHRQKPGAGNKIIAPMGDSPMSGLSQSRTVEEPNYHHIHFHILEVCSVHWDSRLTTC